MSPSQKFLHLLAIQIHMDGKENYSFSIRIKALRALVNHECSFFVHFWPGSFILFCLFIYYIIILMILYSAERHIAAFNDRTFGAFCVMLYPKV